MAHLSKEIEGLRVTLDKLVYRYEPHEPPHDKPHAFIYFISIHNDSDRTVKFLARKWIITSESEDTEVIEGNKIVGETPILAPGEVFSYNSCHLSAGNCTAHGAYHGIDDANKRIFVKIPPFALYIPDAQDIQ